ncbi:hypothetical protein [Siccibacter turicensis]|uniref:Uncharacterized protein n=1 Tax=Siccibacter turicensis TaxID=357233 RepID=A0A2P8VQ29_9ENTR|nr:hypothetical protein [Siccibacter turicensis]PSN09500.1 hypothetical protein C7G83_01765 [Siccibacter turicensis]
MNWWLFPEQDEFKKSFPYFGVGIVYALVVVICVAIRAVTWPDNKHVDLSFLIQAVVVPVFFLTALVLVISMAYHGTRHYTETRLLIAARQKYDVVSYARDNITLAGWSTLTPPKATRELALSMLQLEGEFPLAAKMPLKIELEESFDFTRTGQALIQVLEPLAEKLSQYRRIEAVVWVRGGDESCSDELRRVLKHYAITATRITFLSECPGYTQIAEWIKKADMYIVERLFICVDLHADEEESMWMENATALLFTNNYVKTQGEKPVYLYQPMTGITDVESKVPVYLLTETVSKPKRLWYCGLSRTQKYPLLEALDDKKMVPDRLELEISLGEHGAGYRWLMLALAADAVTYAQGDQLVATSEQNTFSMTALSSRLTRQPHYPQQKIYMMPWQAGGIAGLTLFFGILIILGSSDNSSKFISGWFIVILAIICTGFYLGAGALITWLFANKAREHMGM